MVLNSDRNNVSLRLYAKKEKKEKSAIRWLSLVAVNTNHCLSIQVLMFTSDGSVKQNTQLISLPYQSSEHEFI